MAVKISSFGLVCIYGIMSYLSYTCISMTKSLIWICEKLYMQMHPNGGA